MTLHIVPITLRDAQAYVEQHHRHHGPPRGHLWSIGATDDSGQLVGARVARAMGYQQILTYTLTSETGASLRAVGWHPDHTTTGGTWHRPSLPRTDTLPTGPKTLWRHRLET